MLMTHYREPIDFTLDRLEQAERMWRRWGRIEESLARADGSRVNALKANPAPQAGVLDFLSDDLNTHGVITIMQTLARRAEAEQQPSAEQLVSTAEFLGLDLGHARLLDEVPDVEKAIVSDLMAARVAARKAKNYAEADRIRDELDAMGIALMDSKNPETGELETTWEVKR
jgi:cysteinyl-tRNA synthetase